MTFRIASWFTAAVLLVFTSGWAHGEWAGQPGAADEASGKGKAALPAVDNLIVTIEFPRSSPHLQSLSQFGVEAVSGDGFVRLRLPMASEQLAGLTLAEVAEEPITLGDLRRALALEDQEIGDEHPTPVNVNPMEVLRRLVDIRLIAREGREIGLDELPDNRKMVDVFYRRMLRQQLVERRIKGVQADEAKARKLYEEEVQEWRIRGVTLKKEEDAKTFRHSIEGGASFDEAARKYVVEEKGTLKGGMQGEYVNGKDLHPEIRAMIEGMSPGSVTPVMTVGNEFWVFQLQETRIPEDEETKVRSRQRALNFAQNKALVEYNRQLVDKYSKVDMKMVSELNFGGSTENFLGLLKDDRSVAIVDGEEPVKVSDIARGIQEIYFHGIEKAFEKEEFKDMKFLVLNDILMKRVFLKEALVQGIDKTPEFMSAVADYENSVVFGAFVEKVLRPEIKITPIDLREYYEGHIDRYTIPVMVQLRFLTFGNASAAQAALDKLKKGADFRWMKDNADGQVQSENSEVIRISGKLVTVQSLPEALRQALGGRKESEFLFYKQEGTFFHVGNIEKWVPSRMLPLEDVQKDVGQRAYKEKMDKAMKEWTERLKNVYGAKVYAKEFGG